MTTFLWTMVLLSGIVVAVALSWDRRKHRSVGDLWVSPFWYFTLLWVLAFPLRAWLLGSGAIVTQSQRTFDADELAVALGLAIVVWAAVWTGYARARPSCPPASEAPPGIIWPCILVIALSIAGIAVTPTIMDGSQGAPGHGYFAARMSKGWLFLIPELPTVALTAAAPLFVGRTLRGFPALLAAVTVASVVVLAFLLLPYLSTRRHIALLAMVAIMTVALGAPRRWKLAAVAVLGTILGTPLLDIARTFAGYAVGKSLADAAVLTLVNFVTGAERMAYQFSSTFEGVDHMARLWQVATPSMLLTGIDHGTSWLFNAGLSLLPRAVWPSKPVSNGNIAQQEFLYPELFQSHVPQVAQPPGLVVDYLFGFGLPGALVLALMTGWLLKRLGTLLVDPTAPAAARAIALFSFVNMFNLVRGGTGFLNGLVIFLLVTVLMYGPRHVLDGLRAVLPRTGPQSHQEA